MEVRIIKDLAKHWEAKNEELSPQRTQRAQRRGEEGGIREERNDKEFSPQRTQRAQRWGEEGERKETRLKVESPDRVGISGRESLRTSDRRLVNPREEESNAPRSSGQAPRPRPSRGKRRTQRLRRGAACSGLRPGSQGARDRWWLSIKYRLPHNYYPCQEIFGSD